MDALEDITGDATIVVLRDKKRYLKATLSAEVRRFSHLFGERCGATGFVR